MNLLQTLCETYDACVSVEDYVHPPRKQDGTEQVALLPLCHAARQAHICITIDTDGNFKDAEALGAKPSLAIPMTEQSASRANAPAPHPLADKLAYCDKAYKETKKETESKAKQKSKKGKEEGKKSKYELYHEQLSAWAHSDHTHPHLRAVLQYVEKGTIAHDLLQKHVLEQDDQGNYFFYEDGKGKGKKSTLDYGSLLVVWKVLSPNLEEESRTWCNTDIQEAWIHYLQAQEAVQGFCMIQGKTTPLMAKHPRGIRYSCDNAKLISSNDDKGFTFRGHFLEVSQACTVGYEASQKAHNALRWLIARQQWRNDTQVVLAWAPNGVPVPPPDWKFSDDIEALFKEDEEAAKAGVIMEDVSEPRGHADMGKAFADRLSQALKGYNSDLSNVHGISILALDSASKGRMAVTYYSHQLVHDYLERIKAWQTDCVWLFTFFSKDKGKKKSIKRILRAPLLKEIIVAAYGEHADTSLGKATVSRLLPCIVEKATLPQDIIMQCINHVCRRNSVQAGMWQHLLETTCALYKAYYARHPHKGQRRTYTMSLEKERTTRDYLFGRLLAAAEYTERQALNISKETRPTNAERLFQRFADQPYATWRTIELQLSPYLRRLETDSDRQKYNTAHRCKKLIQEIMDQFAPEDFTNNSTLSGEFLLGYHCQMSALYTSTQTTEGE